MVFCSLLKSWWFVGWCFSFRLSTVCFTSSMEHVDKQPELISDH